MLELCHFVDPPAAFRSVPFWALNDVLEPAEIERQLEAFADGGLGGAYLHSRIGLLTEYLGGDWWHAMDAGVRACERLGIECWFYDEDKWPSGFAGGKVPLQSEDFHARSLHRLPVADPVPEKAEVLYEDSRFRYVCAKVPMGNAWFNGTCWVDLMNPNMVKAFIDCSYRPYAEKYRDKVGTVVHGIFTDEPQFSPRALPGDAGAVPYSPGIRQDFIDQHGYDVVGKLACLFEDADGFAPVRLHYFQTLARRLEASFSKQIGDYCEASGLTWTGHYNGENAFRTVQMNVGNMMIQYRHMQRPGIDKLGLHVGNMSDVHMMRSLSSVANQYGRSRRLSEMFGISGHNMTFEDRKWIADAHAVLGVNHICPHLSLYSMKGCRKRDYPPTLSPQQPYWSDNGLIEDYMARVSYLSSVGTYAAELLLLHPIESAYIDNRNGNQPGDLDAGNQRFSQFCEILQDLQTNHRDYDLGDEEILADIGAVEDGILQVGKMQYPAVLLPPMRTIRATTVELLSQLVAAGGRALALGRLPRLIDGKPDPEVLAVLANTVDVITPDDLAQQLPPAVILTGTGAEHVWTMRRLVAGAELVMLSNQSRLETARIRVQLTARVRTPVVWDPVNGRRFEAPANGDGTALLELAPAQTLFISTGSLSLSAQPNGTYCLPDAALPWFELTGSWTGRRLDPNAITLDFARYSTDGGVTFTAPEPVLGIYQRFGQQRYSGPLQLAFDVNVENVPSVCDLVLEQPEMFRRISANGQDIRFDDNRTYRDIAFRCTDVASCLRKGTNTILLELDFVAPIPDSLDAYERYGTEIESIYLVGDFGVAARRSPEPPAPTQRNAQGIFQERPVHRFRSFSITHEATEFAGDLAPQGYPFYAGAFGLTKTFILPNLEPDCCYSLVFDNTEAVVIHTELNGHSLPPIAWSPWSVDITNALQPGSNELKITLVNSLRNLCGPHHHREGELIRVGPDSFTGRTTWTGGGPGDADWYDARLTREPNIWRDDYHCIPFGFLTPPTIVKHSADG